MAVSQQAEAPQIAAAPAEEGGPGRLQRASRIISTATKWSAATGLIPVPVVDLAALAAVQVKMVSDVSRLYGQTFTEDAVRGVVSVLLGTLLPSTVAHYATTAIVRGVPGAGWVVGAISYGALGAAATYAVGKVFVRHYERGGSFHDFNAKDVEADLKRDFAAARA